MTFLNIDKDSVNTSLLPSVFIDEVVLEGVSSNTKKNGKSMARHSASSPKKTFLGIHTTLSFKYISSGKQLPPWMESEEFLQSLKIRAILVSDKAVYSQLVSFSSGRLTKYIFNDAKIHEILNENCQIQEISVGKELRTFNKEDYQSYQLGTSKREEMVNIPFQIKFDPLDVTGSDHLCLFVYPYIDLQQTTAVAKEYSDTNVVVAASSVGEVKVKPIIQNSKVVQESFLLRRADNNKIYLGEFHTMQNGTVMTGKTHTDKSLALIKEKVPDLSIKDYRRFSQHKGGVADLTIPKNAWVPELDSSFVRNIRDNLDNRNKTIYFSDIWISRNQFGDCSFTFAMNLKKIILENTKYPKLLEIYPRLFDTHVRLQSLKIWRRRVKDLKPVGFQSMREEVFSGYKPPLFNSGIYGASSGVSSERSYNADERKIVIAATDLSTAVNAAQNSIRKLSLRGLEKSGVSMVAVRDHAVSQIGAGIYRYEIEVEVEDHLDTFLRGKVNMLGSSLKQMEDYYVLASQPQIQGKKSSNSKSYTKNYNAKSRKFSQKFVEEMSRKYKKVSDTPWWRAAGIIIDTMKMMSVGNAQAFTRTFLVQMADPRTATAESTLMVIQLMQKLKAELSRLVEEPSSPSSDQSRGSTPKNKLSGLGDGVASAALIKNIVKISHIFSNDYFDASMINHVGYDFLLKKDQDFAEGGQTSVMRRVTAKQFNDRVNQEQEKYFTGEIAPQGKGLEQARGLLNLSSYKYSFLSPSRLKVGDRINTSLLCLGLPLTDDFPYKKFALAASEIANAKLIVGQPLTHVAASLSGGSIEKGASVPRKSLAADQDQAESWAISKNLIKVLSGKDCIVERFVKPEEARSEDKEVTKESSKSLSFNSFFSDTSTLRTQTQALSAFEEQGFRKMFGVDVDFGKEEFDCDKMFLALLFNFALGDQDFKGGETNITPRSMLSAKKFDVNDTNNRLSCIPKNSQPLEEGSLSAVGLNTLPNQIKALFLSSISAFSNFVNFSLFRKDGDIFKDPLRAYTYFFSFFHLIRIEVFDGFKMLTVPTLSNESGGEDAKTLIHRENLESRRALNVKMPKWKLLTKKEFDDSVVNGRELFCRAAYYENSALGLRPIPGLRLPIFDKYFLIRPPTHQNAGVSAPSTSVDREAVANLDRVVNQVKPEFLVSSAMLNATSTATGQTSTTRATTATATTGMTRGSGTGGGY